MNFMSTPFKFAFRDILDYKLAYDVTTPQWIKNQSDQMLISICIAVFEGDGVW